jgi:hypothetical protein
MGEVLAMRVEMAQGWADPRWPRRDRCAVRSFSSFAVSDPRVRRPAGHGPAWALQRLGAVFQTGFGFHLYAALQSEQEPLPDVLAT